MNKIILILSTGLLIQFCSGEPTPESPVPSFVVKLPNPGHWIERLEPTEQAKKNPGQTEAPRILTKESILFEEIRKDLSKWSDGNEAEQWLWHGVLYHRVAGRKDIYINDPNMESSVVIPSVKEWTEFSWVGTTSFEKRDSLNGKACLVYKKINVLNPLKAWIDSSTFLPLRLETANQMITYEYLSPPSSPPTLSPAFEKTIHDYLDRLKSMTVPRAPR